MIGIGTDIVETERLQKAIARSGEAFIKRFLTPAEQSIAAEKGQAALAFYAGRWAAKEAVSKLLGTGIGKDCSFQDITILNNEKGAPYVILSGAAGQRAAELGIRKIHLSISHERCYCVAAAIGE